MRQLPEEVDLIRILDEIRTRRSNANRVSLDIQNILESSFLEEMNITDQCNVVYQFALENCPNGMAICYRNDVANIFNNIIIDKITVETSDIPILINSIIAVSSGD
jgi:hypothetical protein